MHLNLVTNQNINTISQFLEFIIEDYKEILDNYIIEEKKRRENVQKIGVKIINKPKDEEEDSKNKLYVDDMVNAYKKRKDLRDLDCKEAMLLPYDVITEKPKKKGTSSKKINLIKNLYLEQ